MIIILDIETQELVPASRDLSQMRLSIAGAQDGERTCTFAEDETAGLFALMDEAELIVGHNLFGFDYKILQRYATFDVAARYRPKTFDILRIIEQKTGRLISLNDLAKRNLGIEKLGTGKDAPALFHDGRIEELKSYLAQDLRITQQLFEHVRNHGRLKYGHINYHEPVEREVVIRPSDR